jgi:hypothetical protein
VVDCVGGDGEDGSGGEFMAEYDDWGWGSGVEGGNDAGEAEGGSAVDAEGFIDNILKVG